MDHRIMHRLDEWSAHDIAIDAVSSVRNVRGQSAGIIHASSYADLVRLLRKRVRKPGAKVNPGRTHQIRPELRSFA